MGNKLTPYQIYTLYLGYKLHFTSKYDFIKYGPLRKISEKAFDSKPEKSYCYRISTLVRPDDIPNLFISGFIKDPDFWIVDFVGQEALTRLSDYVKVKQSFSYIFEQEIFALFEAHGELDSVRYAGFNPPILERYYSGELHLQTLVAFDRVTGIFEHFDRHMSFDPLWQRTFKLAEKFSPFFKTDRKKLVASLLKCRQIT